MVFRRSTIFAGFAGIYIDPATLTTVRQNINYLMPDLWNRVDEQTRQGFGIRYGKFIANNVQERAALARQLSRLVGQAGKVPKQVIHAYVFGLVEVFLTNGNGVAWNAEPNYIEMINSFDQDEAIIAMLVFLNENLASRLQFSLCQEKYRGLMQLVSGKISAPAARELLAAIRDFSGPLDKMKDNSRMKQKVSAMQTMI